MQLRSFDYSADTCTSKGGLARVASLIRTLRAEAETRGDLVLTFDNGDSLQGTPLDGYAMDGQTRPHVFYRALGLIGYDAAGLGNHDFNFGLSALADSLAEAPIPMLCANIRRVDGEALPVQRWTVLDRTLAGRPLRIGVFSVLPPQTLIWDAHHLSGRVIIDDITETARKVVGRLQQTCCDLVIALAHTGLGDQEHRNGQENALWPLSRIDGLDAIIAGHQHLRVPDPTAPDGSDLAQGLLAGTPAVMPGTSGAYVGAIDLGLSWQCGHWTVTQSQASLHEVDGDPDDQVTRLTAPLHCLTRQALSETVGTSPLPLHSYFGFVAPSPALALIADAKAHAVRSLIEIPDEVALLSSVSPAKMGGRGGPGHYVDIPAGPLSLRHIHDLCFFPNHLSAVLVTGAQLRDWLEMSAGIYSQLTPGVPDQVLLDPSRPAHGSDVLYGVDFSLDLSQPARFDIEGRLNDPDTWRVTHLRYQGRDVTDEDRFVVALNSYRANGGGNVAALKDGNHLSVAHKPVRLAMRDYLGAGLFPSMPWHANGQFTSLNGTEVVLKTGPGAAGHVTDLGPLFSRFDGLDDEGFLRIVLSL